MKKRLLTGDRPTGLLHLGHYVGSIKNRLKLQDQYECYFLIADLHMLTTKKEKEHILASRQHIHDMVLDYLSCGSILKNRQFVFNRPFLLFMRQPNF